MDEYYIRIIDLPIEIKGFTMYDASTDSYNIYLNGKYDSAQNKTTLEHELQHIQNKDFNKNCNADVVENNVRESLLKLKKII